jgi:2-haloacid dehalogenase
LARSVAKELELFDDILISGEIGVTKPDPRAFEQAVARFGVSPVTTFFVDDIAANVHASRAAGFTGLLFTSAAELRQQLVSLGVLRR